MSKTAFKSVSKVASKPALKPAAKAIAKPSPKPTAKAKPAPAAPAPVPAPVTPPPAPAPVSPPLSAMPANLADKVCLSALSFTPMGFLPCDGSQSSVSAAPTVFALLGKKYGGDGKTTFGMPNLSGIAPASATIHYVLALDPQYSPMTSNDFSNGDNLGFIRLLKKGAALPKGYLYCDGSLLPIAQDCALFSLLGTFFGGDGVKTFVVPDLRKFETKLGGARYVIAEYGIFPCRLLGGSGRLADTSPPFA